MATRTRKKAPDPQNGANTAPVEETEPVILLEEPNEEIMSHLTVMGNSMQIAAQRLKDVAPGWSAAVTALFEHVGELIKGPEEEAQ